MTCSALSVSAVVMNRASISCARASSTSVVGPLVLREIGAPVSLTVLQSSVSIFLLCSSGLVLAISSSRSFSFRMA